MATQLNALSSDQIKSRNIATLKQAKNILDNAIEVEETAFSVDTKMVEKLKATREAIKKAIDKAGKLFESIKKKNARLLVMSSKEQYSLNNLYEIAIKAANGDKAEIEKLQNEQSEDISAEGYTRGFWKGLVDDNGQIGGIKVSNIILGVSIASMVIGLMNPASSYIGLIGGGTEALGANIWNNMNFLLPLTSAVLEVVGLGFASGLAFPIMGLGLALAKKFGAPLASAWKKTFFQKGNLKELDKLFANDNTKEGFDLSATNNEAVAYQTITHLNVGDKTFDVDKPQEIQSFVNEINQLGVKATYDAYNKKIRVVDAIQYGSGTTYDLTKQSDLQNLNAAVEKFGEHTKGAVVHMDGIAFNLFDFQHRNSFYGKADLKAGLVLTGNTLETLGLLTLGADSINLQGKTYSYVNPEELKQFESDFDSFAKNYRKHEAEVKGYDTLSLKESDDLNQLIAIVESTGNKLSIPDSSKWFEVELKVGTKTTPYNILNPTQKADLVSAVDGLVKGLGITVEGKPYNLGNDASRNSLTSMLTDLGSTVEFVGTFFRIDGVGIDVANAQPEDLATIQSVAQAVSKTRRVTAGDKTYDLAGDGKELFVKALQEKGADVVVAGNTIMLNGCPYNYDKTAQRRALGRAADSILKEKQKITVGLTEYDFTPADGDTTKTPVDNNNFSAALKVLGVNATIVNGTITINGKPYDLTKMDELFELARVSNALHANNKRFISGKEFDLNNETQAQNFAETLTALGINGVTFDATDKKVKINGVDVLSMSLEEVVKKVQQVEKNLEENTFTIAGKEFKVVDDTSFKQFKNTLAALGADVSKFSFDSGKVKYNGNEISATELADVIKEITKASGNVEKDVDGDQVVKNVTIEDKTFDLTNADDLELFKQTLTALGVKPSDVLNTGNKLKVDVAELGAKIAAARENFKNKTINLGSSDLKFSSGKGADLSSVLKTIGVTRDASALEGMTMDDLVKLIKETNDNFKNTVVVAEVVFKLPGDAQKLDNTLTALSIDPKEILDGTGVLKADVNLETLASKVQEAEKNITTQKDGAGNVTSYAVITVAGKAFTIKDNASLETFKNALLALGITKEDVDKIKIDGDALKFDGQPLTNATLTTLVSHVKAATDKFTTKEFIIGGSRTTFDTLNKTNLQNKLKVIGIKLDDSIDLENLSLNDELVGLFDKAQENFGRVIVISDKSYNIPGEASNLKVALTALGFDQINLDKLFSGDSLKNGVDLNYLTQKIQEAEKSLTGYFESTGGSTGIEHPVTITISGHSFELRSRDDSFNTFINALKVYGVPQKEIQKISFDGQLKYDGRTLVGDDFANFMEQVGMATKNKSDKIIYVAGQPFDLKVDDRAKDLVNTLTALGIKNVKFDESAKKVTIDGKDVLSMDQATISKVVEATNNFTKDKPTLTVAGQPFDLANDKDLSDFKKALTALGVDYKAVITDDGGLIVDNLTALIAKVNEVNQHKQDKIIVLGNTPYSTNTTGDPPLLSDLKEALKVIGVEKDDKADLSMDEILDLVDKVEANKGKEFHIKDQEFILPEAAEKLAQTLTALGIENVVLVKDGEEIKSVSVNGKDVADMDLKEIVDNVKSAEKAFDAHTYTIAGKQFKLESEAEDLAIALTALGVKAEHVPESAEDAKDANVKIGDKLITDMTLEELTEQIGKANESFENKYITLGDVQRSASNPDWVPALGIIGLDKTEDDFKDLTVDKIITLAKDTNNALANRVVKIDGKTFNLKEEAEAENFANTLNALGVEAEYKKAEGDTPATLTIKGKPVEEMSLGDIAGVVYDVKKSLTPELNDDGTVKTGMKFTIAGTTFEIKKEDDLKTFKNALLALGVEKTEVDKYTFSDTDKKVYYDGAAIDLSNLDKVVGQIKDASEAFKNNTFTVAGKPFTLTDDKEKSNFVATMKSLNSNPEYIDLGDIKALTGLIGSANEQFERQRVCVSANGVEYFELSNANELEAFKQTLTALGLNPEDYYKDGKVNVEKLATLSEDVKEKQDSNEIILDGVTYNLTTEDGRNQLATAAQEIFGTECNVDVNSILIVSSSTGGSVTKYDLKELGGINQLAGKAAEKFKAQERDEEGNLLYPAPTQEQRVMVNEYREISLAQLEIAIRHGGSITVGDKTVSEKAELEAIRDAKLASIAYMGHETAAKSRDISGGMGSKSTISDTVEKFDLLSPEAVEMAIQLFTADDETRGKFASMAGTGSNIQSALKDNTGRRDACLNILLIVKHKKEIEKGKGRGTSAVETKKAPTRDELLACFDAEGKPLEGVTIPDNLKGLTPDQVKQMLEWLPEAARGDSE